MKIRVDWFKLSGKWYCNEDIEIGGAQLWQPEFMQAIVDNQTALNDSWPGDFHVVTGDLEVHDDDPDYNRFSHSLIFAPRWAGMQKSPDGKKRALKDKLERFRNSTDQAEYEQLGNELGEMIIG